VGDDDDTRAGLGQGLDGGDGRADAAVVGDVPGVVERDVEVAADEDALAAKLARVDEVLSGLHGDLSPRRGG